MIATTPTVLASQLPLPFAEARVPDSTAPDIDASRASRGQEAVPSVEPASAEPLAAIRDYLRRHFPGFVLQQRSFSSGSAQFTLYRVPDGTLYRLTVERSFLTEPRQAGDIEMLLDASGLREKLPASVLSPVLLDHQGVHVPVPPIQPEQGAARVRSGLGWMLLGRLIEATGLSFPLIKERSPS